MCARIDVCISVSYRFEVVLEGVSSLERRSAASPGYVVFFLACVQQLAEVSVFLSLKLLYIRSLNRLNLGAEEELKKRRSLLSNKTSSSPTSSCSRTFAT